MSAMDAQTVEGASHVARMAKSRVEHLEHELAQYHDWLGDCEARMAQLKGSIRNTEQELLALRSWLHTAEE